jgi:pyruvate,water dikinase
VSRIFSRRGRTLLCGRYTYWRRVYEQDLIPFAHGVRRFGAHYAAVVKPTDPFEFVRILAGTDMLAARRNRMLERLAARLRKSPRLAAAVKRRGLDADRGLAKAARRLLERSFDIEFAGERLSSREDILVANLLALAARPPHRRPRITAARPARVAGPKVAGKARQLIGQPAAPGLAQGRARIVTTAADLKAFQPGEVLICDAIQPNMTHLVPLAAAIVERRGGMLIHGAIIARELGIPCVNGVPDAGRAVANGEELTVDGHLGIVSVGRPELALMLQYSAVGRHRRTDGARTSRPARLCRQPHCRCGYGTL